MNNLEARIRAPSTGQTAAAQTPVFSAQGCTAQGTEYTVQQMTDIMRLLSYRESQAVVERIKDDINTRTANTDATQNTMVSEDELRAIARDTSFSPELVDSTLQDYRAGRLSAQEADIINYKNPLFEKKYDRTLTTPRKEDKRHITANITFVGAKFSTIPYEIAAVLNKRGYLLGNGWRQITAPADGQAIIGIIKPRKGLRKNLYIANIDTNPSFSFIPRAERQQFTAEWHVGVYGDHEPEVSEILKEILAGRPTIKAVMMRKPHPPQRGGHYRPL